MNSLQNYLQQESLEKEKISKISKNSLKVFKTKVMGALSDYASSMLKVNISKENLG